jgi:hypothetical protein
MDPEKKNPLPAAESDGSNKVTLENLLRFKRCEQPPPEFWQQFDRELRAKQLAAIVARRPWWTPLARYVGVVSRYSLPLGAAAALAIAFAGVHEYRVYVPARASADDAQSTEASVPTVEPVEVAMAVTPVPVRSNEHPNLVTVSGERSVAKPVVYHDSAKRETAAPARMDARSLAFDAGSESTESSSDLWVASNLAAAQAAEPEAVRNLLGMSSSLDGRMVPAVRTHVEPLEQMDPPAAEQRSRLLGGVVPALATYNGTVPVPVNDRVVKDLSDDRLYESISRYSEGGDYLSIKVKF